jgi:glucoamylase
LTGERAHYELAAGNDTKLLLRSFERFASFGGMLPEQIWDHADMPSEALYLGRSAGSAQPLVWAHSEYLKLLRSISDGKVFDRISAVEDRYAVEPGKRTFKNKIEIFQFARPIETIPAGQSLRIIDRDRFRVVWSLDGWATAHTQDSRVVGYPGSYVDIPTSEGQTCTIVFTLFWPGQDRWLGRNCEVKVVSEQPETMPAEEKPIS